MTSFKFALVPAVAVALWIATTASVVLHLESMSRAQQQARVVPTASASVVASR